MQLRHFLYLVAECKMFERAAIISADRDFNEEDTEIDSMSTRLFLPER